MLLLTHHYNSEIMSSPDPALFQASDIMRRYGSANNSIFESRTTDSYESVLLNKFFFFQSQTRTDELAI